MHNFQSRLRPQSSGLGGFQDPFPDAIQGIHIGVAGDQIYFREGGNYVGGESAVADDVVDTGFLGNVLAQHFHRIQHDHGAIERGAAPIGCGGSMRRGSIEAEQGAIIREARTEIDAVGIARMPGEHRIYIFEQTGVNKIDLAAAALFGRRTVITNSPFETARLQFFLNGYRSQRRRAAQQIVAATVSGSAVEDG